MMIRKPFVFWSLFLFCSFLELFSILFFATALSNVYFHTPFEIEINPYVILRIMVREHRSGIYSDIIVLNKQRLVF